MKFEILITILAIVLVAGCTVPSIPGIPGGVQPVGSVGKGLEITSFTAEPTPVHGNAKVRVNMEVENQGGTTVPHDQAIAYLTGTNVNFSASGDDTKIYWHSDSTVIGCSGTEKACSQFVNTSSDSCASLQSVCSETSSTNGTCTGTATPCASRSQTQCGASSGCTWSTNQNETQLFTKNVTTADVVKGTPAGTARFSWTLVSPDIPSGQVETDTFYGRVYSNYQTAVRGDVWVYTQGESDASKASNRALNKASFTSTLGPVGLDVKVSPDPVIFYDNGEQFSLTITITNQASGNVYAKVNDYTHVPSIGDNDWNQVYINVVSPTGITSITSDCNGSNQTLPAGKSTTLVCDYTIPSSPGTFKSYPFVITAQYGYYTQESATVTLQGR